MNILPTFEEFISRNPTIQTISPMNSSPIIPAVVALLAGRRPDEATAESTRFPSANVKEVRQRLHDLFIRENFTTLVSSAACGADLLALEVAAELQLQTVIVLPFAPKAFRRLSVTDRPGDWGDSFDRMISRAINAGTLENLGYNEDDPAAFLETNKAMVVRARELANSEVAPIGVMVWEGRSRGEDDATEQFGHLCHQAGYRVVEVSTLS